MSIVTRGLGAFGTLPTAGLGFAGLRAPAAAIGGGKKRRSKYPRRVYINGKAHWVRNADEERELLRAHIATLEARVERETVAKGPSKAKPTLRVLRRYQKRLEAVDQRADDWLAHLRAEDEEILILLLH